MSKVKKKLLYNIIINYSSNKIVINNKRRKHILSIYLYTKYVCYYSIIFISTLISKNCHHGKNIYIYLHINLQLELNKPIRYK